MSFEITDETSTLLEYADVPLGSSDSFWIKRFFLSFLQAFFAENRKFTWSASQSTKIIIADKFAFDLDLAHMKPCIVLSRGYTRFLGTNIGQYFSRSLLSDNAIFTDLIGGSITINCMAKNGIICEELADIIKNALVGYKDQLRANGLHSLGSITVGEERVLESDAEVKLTVVPVSVEFTKQNFITTTDDFYVSNVKLSFSGTAYGNYSGHVYSDTTFPLQLFENRDYTVFASGIVFVSGFAPPVNSTLSLRYIEKVTLSEVSETPSGTINGTNRTFYTTQGIYGYSPLLADVRMSGITLIDDGYDD